MHECGGCFVWLLNQSVHVPLCDNKVHYGVINGVMIQSEFFLPQVCQLTQCVVTVLWSVVTMWSYGTGFEWWSCLVGSWVV